MASVQSSVSSSDVETTVAVDEILALENVSSSELQPPSPPPVENYIPQHLSTSAKKLKKVIPSLNENIQSDRSGDDSDTDVNDENNFGYVFIDIEILISVINNLAKCKQCGSNVKTIHDLSKKQGLANLFRVTCSTSYCDYEDTFITRKPLKKETSGRPAYDINIRSIVAFREGILP